MADFSSFARRTGHRSRRRFAGALAGATTIAVLLFAALAYACAPQTSMGFDRSGYQYQAGETVGVTASGLQPSVPFELTMTPPSGSATPVGSGGTTDSAGEISTAFTLPSPTPTGDYLIKAQTTVITNGQSVSRVAREILTVVPAPDPPAPPPVVPTPPKAPAAVLAPAAAGTSFITGTSGNDTITGTPFADVVMCGAGNDRVRGLGGNDVIKCGGGNDLVDGGPGNDKLLGGPGNDTLRGNAGPDTLRGNAGSDRLFGGPGADLLYRDRKDRVSGGAGRDSMVSVK